MRPSPLQNRVLPSSEIIATPARGTMMGNRGGVLHLADRTLSRARWRSWRWICCVLRFRGRQRTVMSPNTYTELFFLDEAVALAAGHRPCAECRRGAYNAFRKAFTEAGYDSASADRMDVVLHAARLSTAPLPVAPVQELPTGAFVLIDTQPHLVTERGLFPFRVEGYESAIAAPKAPVPVMTPAPLVGALSHGYRPELHPTTR